MKILSYQMSDSSQIVTSIGKKFMEIQVIEELLDDLESASFHEEDIPRGDNNAFVNENFQDALRRRIKRIETAIEEEVDNLYYSILP